MIDNTIVINSAICDTRSIRLEDYADCKRIVLNPEVLIVSPSSRKVLSQLPVTLNAGVTVELDDDGTDVNTMTINGDFVLTKESAIPPQTILTVNGNLRLSEGAQKVMGDLLHVIVNGTLTYPESLSVELRRFSVVGSVFVEPAGYTVLSPDFVMDRYFPLRAKENTAYYAKNSVAITDPETDIASMAGRNISFRTGALVICESLVPSGIPMFNEELEVRVIPEGYAYIKGDQTLTQGLVYSYGTALYIDGDLTVPGDRGDVLSQLTGLNVSGRVFMSEADLGTFRSINATCGALCFEKGKVIKDMVRAEAGRDMLTLFPSGVHFEDCALVIVASDLSAGEITSHFSFSDCALVLCTREQKSAVLSVCEDVAIVRARDEDKKDQHTSASQGKDVDVTVDILDTVSDAADRVEDVLKERGISSDISDKIRSGLNFLKDRKIISMESFKM